MIQALVNLINEPEPDHPLRGDLAEEYSKDKKKFMKNAGMRFSKYFLYHAVFFISNESNGTLVSETRIFDRSCLFLLLSLEKFD